MRIKIKVLAALLMSGTIYADDLQSLCNSLKNETVTTAPASSSSQQNSSSSASPRKKKTTPVAASVPTGQQRNVILGPKDKFPPQVTGMYVAGNFMPKFLQSDGLVLVPAEDFMNPFARQFIVSNVNTGVYGAQVVPVQNPHLVQISPNRPLVIISRGIIPGSYIVNTQ